MLGGADLFLQGVLAPPGGLPDFLAGSPRSLSVPGNPIPFAGGVMQPGGGFGAGLWKAGALFVHRRSSLGGVGLLGPIQQGACKPIRGLSKTLQRLLHVPQLCRPALPRLQWGAWR